jgi:hypothetical protein
MICWLELSSNDVMHSSQYKYLISSISAKASREDCGKQGFFLESYYFRDSIALSTSKALIKHTWINDHDRFRSPSK